MSILNQLKLEVKVLEGNDDLPLPEYMTEGASGLDLRAAVKNSTSLEPGDILLIPTGLVVKIPFGYEAQIRPRSGLALKHGITVLNSPGTVDSDYRGEIGVILCNLSKDVFTVNRGDRIAQMVISKIEKVKIEKVDNISNSERGVGGFGHTDQF